MTYGIPSGFALFIARYARTGDPEEMLNMIGGATAGDIGDLMNAFNTAVVDTLLTQTTPSITYIGCTVLTGNGDAEPPYETFEAIANEPGSSGTYNLTPQNSAVLVHKNLSVGETGRAGRIYWPVLGENFCNNVGVLDPDVLADLQTVWDNFYDELVAGSIDPVVFHQVGALNGGPASVGSFIVDQLIATQRQRLRR